MIYDGLVSGYAVKTAGYHKEKTLNKKRASNGYCLRFCFSRNKYGTRYTARHKV